MVSDFLYMYRHSISMVQKHNEKSLDVLFYSGIINTVFLVVKFVILFSCMLFNCMDGNDYSIKMVIGRKMKLL